MTLLLKISLPFPPTTNSLYWQKGKQQRYKSPGYKAWLKKCPKLTPLNINTPVRVLYRVYWPSKAESDLSNRIKAAEDYLVSERVLVDDNWTIVREVVLVHGGVVKKPLARVEIEIHELHEVPAQS
jgi:Holliday junction resolvase RusA-like endonuclease